MKKTNLSRKAKGQLHAAPLWRVRVPSGYAAAKRAPGRRFHALYDHLWRRDVLQEAWIRVKRNKGAAGVDRITLAEMEQYGVERFLEELRGTLRDGEYRAEVVLRRYIPKGDGRERPLGIPTVRDRVVQMAAKLVLEPIFEADFLPCSYGYRPRRSTTMALEVLRKRGGKGVRDGKSAYPERSALTTLRIPAAMSNLTALHLLQCHRI